MQDAQGIESQHRLDLTLLGPDFSEENTLQAIGLDPWRLNIPPVIGEVTDGSAAESSGMLSRDRILNIAGEDVSSWSQIGYLVQIHGDLSLLPGQGLFLFLELPL